MMKRHIIYATATAAAILLPAAYASASPLVFQGQNAALFPGANPADTALLMSSTPRPAPNPTTNNTDLFVQEFAAQVSNKVFNDIYGSGASPSGRDVASNGDIITWSTDGSGVIHVTITKPDGTVQISY